MLENNLVFRLVAFMLLISTCFTSIVQSACNRGCDLALGSYYTQTGSEAVLISMYINTNVIQNYNPNKLANPESLVSFVRINLPFRCDCFDGKFLGHVFNYNLRTGDTYETIAQERYANLTTEDWIQRFNTYDYD
ncbi:putative non-specific serine/threonine protein kinase [Helianthus anomalus]